MRFMKAIQAFFSFFFIYEGWRMGQEAAAVKCPSFLDPDLSQQAFRRAQGLMIHGCPRLLAIHM